MPVRLLLHCVDRKAVRDGLAKEWEPSELDQLSMQNMTGLLEACGGSGHFKWHQVDADQDCIMSVKESGKDGAMCVKVEFTLPAVTAEVYSLLKDGTQRALWDPSIVDMEVLEQLEGENQIHYMAIRGAQGIHDFVLLRSCRYFPSHMHLHRDSVAHVCTIHDNYLVCLVSSGVPYKCYLVSWCCLQGI